jgi:hypothetical protein
VDSFLRDNTTTVNNTLVGDAIFNMIFVLGLFYFVFVTYQLPHPSVLRNEEE